MKSTILRAEVVRLEMIVAGLLRKSNFRMTSTYSRLARVGTVGVEGQLVEGQVCVLLEKVRVGLLFGGVADYEVLGNTSEQLLGLVASPGELVVWIGLRVLTEAIRSWTLASLAAFDDLVLSIII